MLRTSQQYIVGFGLLLVAGASFAASTCPDTAEIGQYRVTAERPRDAQALGGSATGIVLGGLAQWLEARARAELQMWVVQDITRQMCSDELLQGYFPTTCRLHGQLTEFDTLQVSSTYQLLVRAARDDLEYAPACALYRFRDENWPIGYLLQSVFEQYSRGVPLHELLYGLHQHELLNGPDAQRLCRKVVVDNETRLTLYCGVLVPVLAYATALESRDDAAAYAMAFGEKLRDHGLDIAVSPNIDALLARFELAREQINELVATLEEAGSLPRDDAVRDLSRLGSLLSIQIDAISGTFELPPYLARVPRVLNESVQLYNAISTREYVDAVTRLVTISQAICSDGAQCATDTATFDRLVSIGLTTASLAEAKSADDFAKALDDIASPVGTYRLRRRARMWTLGGLPGMSFGRQELTAPGLPTSKDSSASLFAPVGVSFTRPTKRSGSYGVFFSAVDVGNLIDDSSGVQDIGTASIGGEVESSLSGAFSPGVFFTFAPKWSGPLVFGVGGSLGPSAYKTATFDDGRSVTVERKQRFSIFVGVDTVIMPLKRR